MSYLFDELTGKKEGVPDIEDKILLMGLQAAGKTAIKDVVFFNKEPDEVDDYMATVHYQRQFLDEEKKSVIIDSGGQESYWNEAVTHFRHLVFSDVKLLVWIVDVTQPELFEESERRFSFTIRQFKKENPESKIAVLCHKVDLIPPDKMILISQHIQESFVDPRFEIDFENTSIYYPDSLRELIFTIMEEAGINTKRFELISNLEQKVEESPEFQSYKVEHKGDPRIQQLMDYLRPKPEAMIPTFGKIDLQVDLTDYDIVEIVLIEKETFSPVVGASSQAIVNSEMSMDYLVALQEFKAKVKELGEEIEPTGSIISSKEEKVHAMVFNLATNFLLITSFSAISEERQKLLFELILRFAQSTLDTEKEPLVEPEPVVEVPTPETVVEEIVEPTPEQIVAVQAETEIETSEIPSVEEALEVVEEFVPEIDDAPITFEVVNEAEPITETFDEIKDEAALEVEASEIVDEPVTETTLAIEPEVQPDPSIAVPVPGVPQINKPVEVPEVVTEDEVIPEFVEKLVVESIPEASVVIEEVPVIREKSEAVETEPVIAEVEHPSVADLMETTEETTDEDIEIDFSADDIKNFASFLVKKKEVILEESFTTDDIHKMADFLFKSNNNNDQPKEEEIIEETSEEN